MMRPIGVVLALLIEVAAQPAVAADLDAGTIAFPRGRPITHLTARRERGSCNSCYGLPFGGLRKPYRSELPFGGLAPACPHPRGGTVLVRKG